MAIPPAAPLDDVVERAREILSELVARLDDTGLDAARSIADVEGVGRLMDAARVRAAASLAHDALAAERLGFSGAADAVAALAGVTLRSAKSRLAVAQSTTTSHAITGAPLPPRLPHLAAAMLEGDVGLDAAALVSAELESVRTRVSADALDAAERLMVDRVASGTASALSVDHVAVEVRQIAATVDPDGARPREERAARRRAFRLGAHDADGLVPVSGRLLPEVGALLGGILEAHRRSPRFRDAAQDVAEPPIGAIDPRTGDQQRHDAFAEAVLAAASADGAPRLDGSPVSVVVTVSEADLADPEGLAGDAIGVIGGSSAPVSRATVERFIDGHGQRRVRLGADGAVTGIGSLQRCFTPSQRLAIAARDGHRCATPGCTSRSLALQAHHVVPWRDGGPTSTDNGILLCYWHHRRVDDGPWRWRMVGGRPHVRGPGLGEWTPVRGHPAAA